MLARVALASVSALAVLALADAPADAAVKVKLEPVVTGVNTPLAMVQPKGDDRKFVIEQWGRIRIIDAAGNLLRRSSTSATVWSTCGRISTSGACSALRSTRTSPPTASSTSPTAPTRLPRLISPRSSGGITPTWWRCTRSRRMTPTRPTRT